MLRTKRVLRMCVVEPLLVFSAYKITRMFPIHGKNDFAEKSENLDADLKIILLNYENNYARTTQIFCSIVFYS